MPLGLADTKTSGFFRTEGAYTSVGAPIPGGQDGSWLLREGSHIENIFQMLAELCCRRREIFADRLANLLLAHAEARVAKSLDSRRRFAGQTRRFLRSPWPDLGGG
jgi:hypothetical protein